MLAAIRTGKSASTLASRLARSTLMRLVFWKRSEPPTVPKPLQQQIVNLLDHVKALPHEPERLGRTDLLIILATLFPENLLETGCPVYVEIRQQLTQPLPTNRFMRRLSGFFEREIGHVLRLPVGA